MNVLSDTTVSWLRARLGEWNLRVDGGLVHDGDLAWRISASDAEESAVHLRDRGTEEREHVRGRREYVERYFVWCTGAEVRTRLGLHDELLAPTWTAAPGGPLSVRAGGHGRPFVQVLRDDEVVATFQYGSDATEFTHYGCLPVDLLIEQIELPSKETVFFLPFPRRGGRRRWQRKHRKAPARIRRWAVEQLAIRDRAARSAAGAPEEDR